MNNEVIKYDVNIDLKIINTIVFDKNEVTNIGELRNNVSGISNVLERHLSNLVKWGLIQDKKPEKNGVARKISLNVPYGVAMDTIMKLKNAVEIVNEFFNI